MKQILYWTNKEEERQSICESAINSALWELLSIIDESIKSGYAKWEDFLVGSSEIPKIKPKLKNKIIIKGNLRKAIDSKLKIIDVAKKYGLKIEGTKCICPFHNDSKPSLSLSNDKNCFYCFGCNVSGDIIEFVRRLEEWKEKKQ